MTKILSTFVLGSALFASSYSLAAYDEWNCRSSGLGLKNMQLECVSCGAQNYFAKKAGGREVVPSEKWLALLGTLSVQNMNLDGSGKNNIAANSDARANYHKVVISMLKDYGFCQKYISKDWDKRATEQNSDIAPGDWSAYVFKGLTRNTDLGSSELKSLGKYYGFDGSIFGWNAAENMNYLVLNSPDPFRSNNPRDASDERFAAKYPTYNQGLSKNERRPAFVRRLKEALGSGYDVNGEQKKSGIINSGNKDNGLTECLREIERIHDGKGDPLLNSFMRSAGDNTNFCREMANSCEISADFCGGDLSSVRTSPLPAPPAPKGHPSSSPGHKGQSGSGIR